MLSPDEFTIRGLFAGRPQVMVDRRGREVESSIAKQATADEWVHLGETNLDGDRQSDLTVHGGPDKSVCVYPSEHYAGWERDGYAIEELRVGENLALEGAFEDAVRIGEVWRWGEALVQVTQPRTPCFKLSLHTSLGAVGKRMIETRRTGWYLRTLETGMVPASGTIEVVDRNPSSPTVWDALAAMLPDAFPTAPDDTLARVLAEPALAGQWRRILVERHGTVSA